jgi:aryl-alcohol dehydrogenase-like predicted oxidoreductase
LNKEIPIEETVRAMVELKNEGKIKYLGLSECSAESLRRACKIHHIAAVQIEYSPWALDIESPQIDLLRTCRELGVAVVAYSPIGRGMLSGTFRSANDIPKGDFRKLAPRFSDENFPKNLVLVDKIVELAKAKGVTATQLTLAWLMRQGDDIIPIPGTTKVERLEENLESLRVELTDEEEKTVRKACEEAEIHGSRYPEGFMSGLFADTVKE